MLLINSSGALTDIESLYFKKNTIILCNEITEQGATSIILQLLHLSSQEEVKKITMLISSPGGSVYAGMAIIDTMNYIKEKRGVLIETFCVGMAASMAGVILLFGTKNHRKILKHSRVMLHQPLMFIKERILKQTDIKIESELMKELRHELETIIADNTGQELSKISPMLDNDCYLTADQAKEFGTKGIVDVII